MKNKIMTAVFGVAVFVLIITVSITLPIYLRFFYYLQIKPLGLEKYYDYATIKEAYDQMLRYLTLPGGEFKTGALKHTADFASHMYDVKVLFMINLVALLLSAATVITTVILSKKKILTLYRPFGLSVSVISAISIFVVFIIIGGLVAIDFDQAFVIFHKILFPGKDNWLVSPVDDPVIKILPEKFFLNCGILILSSIVVISVSIIVYQLVKRKREREKQKDRKN